MPLRTLNNKASVRLQGWAYKQLRPAALEIERHVLKATDRLAKLGGREVHIPAKARAAYREALAAIFRRMFDAHRQEVRRWIEGRKREAARKGWWEPAGQIQELVEPVAARLERLSYAKQSRFYEQWFRKKAWEIESKRFHDTVKRARDTAKIVREEGLTRKEARQLLAQKFQSYSTYELDRVLTTEDTRILNIATRAECQGDDTIVGFEWRVNYTGCDVCDELDGRFFAKDEAPEIPAHPNCQCTLEPVFSWERNAAVA